MPSRALGLVPPCPRPVTGLAFLLAVTGGAALAVASVTDVPPVVLAVGLVAWLPSLN